MQGVLVAIFTVFAAGASADSFSLVQRGIADFAGIVGSRHKRAATTTSDDCIKQCESKLEEILSNDKLQDEANLEAGCEEFEDTKSCFAKCNEYSVVAEIMQAICDQRQQEAIKHLSCVFENPALENTEELETVCEQKCPNEDAAMSDFSGPTSATCQFLNCAATCWTDAFAQQCPEDQKPEISSFLRGIMMKIVMAEIDKENPSDAAAISNKCFNKTKNVQNNRSSASSVAINLSLILPLVLAKMLI